MSITRFSTSMLTMSPFLTRAMGPPTWASGATWPITKPWEPPEKRPSVMRAHSLPRPAPMMAEVGVNISGMPGPPLGPSYLMTTTLPLKAEGSLDRESSMSSSQSNTRAPPRNFRPSLPVILATEPSGARLPYRIWIWPVCLMGVSMGSTTSWPARNSGTPARFSAMVLPVTVMQSPWMKPLACRYLSTAGVPPTLCTSSIT
mmetsp:Transcript_32903/g.72663  ORF Transcript_32903/g.72663 Transcript_32903/m.72663 type:complete len:202 (+) Transcript_32903:752-1357(+)